MKIVFVVADITFKGGIERVTCNLANDFLEDYEVEIVSFFKSNKSINYILKEQIKIKYITEEIYDGEPGSLKRLFKFMKAFFKINLYFVKQETSFIIAQGMPVALMLFPLNFMKKKVIACEHVHYDYYDKMIKWIRNKLYKYYYKVVVLTSKDKEKFEKNLNNVECIPNYISKISEKKSLLNNKVIISVGRLEEQKGYDILIDICSKLLPNYPDWKLKIFGEGNLKKELENQIVQKKMEKQIFLMGTTNEIEKEYLKSDVYVMSSRFEGMPLVLLEAQSYGIPLVSFDCPNGPSDIIEDRCNGYLIKYLDKKDMLKKLDILIKNKLLRNWMGKECKKRITEFKRENILKLWSELFRREEK